ncbi:hypothetical protein VDG1235_928 [Verrucomicrobiia bacterium DG1235]|nr:hypothetical protein VDG1235_928 [Verrucomicrobiae bacterium DG1235]
MLPDSLAAAIITKVLAFETSEGRSEAVRIHVMDQESLAKQFLTKKGMMIGNRRVESVTWGEGIPRGGVDVIVASNEKSVLAAIEYARKNRAITVSNNPEMAPLGVSLIVYNDEGMPGILLSRRAAQREGLYWEPQILEIAEIIEN